MDAREALARALCIEQGFNPDGLAGRLDVDGKYHAWHLYRVKADAVLAALPSGFTIIHRDENRGPTRKFKLGDRVTKTKGSSWTGHVVGFYSTSLTLVGYCVESENEPGSVQIYPESAIRAMEVKP